MICRVVLSVFLSLCVVADMCGEGEIGVESLEFHMSKNLLILYTQHGPHRLSGVRPRPRSASGRNHAG